MIFSVSHAFKIVIAFKVSKLKLHKNVSLTMQMLPVWEFSFHMVYCLSAFPTKHAVLNLKKCENYTSVDFACLFITASPQKFLVS
jgi:hypothetical protein